MTPSWLEFEQLRQFLPSRQFVVDHRRMIAGVLFALLVWAMFPILTIPVFGIALPLYAGWLTLKSMIADQQATSRREHIERATVRRLRLAKDEKEVLSIPLRVGDRIVSRRVRITRVDDMGITAVDPEKGISNAYPWKRIAMEELHDSLALSGIDGIDDEKRGASSGWIVRLESARNFLVVASLRIRARFVRLFETSRRRREEQGD